MKINVRSKHIAIDETVRSHLERRLAFSLSRLAPHILHATVYLDDINGPRGGEDKVCRIEVRLRPTGTVFVEDRDGDLYLALDRAAERVGRAVSRTIKREHEVHQGKVGL